MQILELSYHDVVCLVGSQEIKILDCDEYRLECTRDNGWMGKDLIAGEYDTPRLHIEVNGIRIL